MVCGNRLSVFVSACILTCALFCTAGEGAWIEVKSPNFSVVSDASVDEAREVAKRLEQFRSVFQSAFPSLKTDLGDPLTVFAARNERSLKGLIPNDWMKNGAAAPVGVFLSGPHRKFIVLHADFTGDQGYHVIYHEYAHLLLNLNFDGLPLWLSEGLAELFGYTTVSDGSSKLGQVNPEFFRVLKASPIIPLRTLISVTRDSPYYRRQDKVRLFYAQSWALAHYLMLGERQLHLPQLNKFLHLIEKGVSGREAVERAFGDLSTLQRHLETYVRMPGFYQYSIKAKLSIQEDRITARELARAESLASRGELLVYADRLDEARTMLERALWENPDIAFANQAMGTLFLRLRNKEQAQKYFSAAANLDSRSDPAQDFSTQTADEKDADTKAADGRPRKAVRLDPQLASAFGMLSQILIPGEGKADIPEALESAVKASRLKPADPRLSAIEQRRLDAPEKSGFPPCQDLGEKDVEIEFLKVPDRGPSRLTRREVIQE